MEEGGVTFVSPQHGVCYMFNFGPLYANQNPGVNMIAANVFYGLSLEIDLESKFGSSLNDVTLFWTIVTPSPIVTLLITKALAQNP